MNRLEFLALLASPALVFIPKEEPKIGIFVDGKQIGTLKQFTFTKDGEEIDLSNYEVSCKVYKMTAKHLKVSPELVESWRTY